MLGKHQSSSVGDSNLDATEGPALFEALEPRLLLAGEAGPAYDVFGGYEDYSGSPDILYNIDRQPDYDYLGGADASATFEGTYDYYVIAARYPVAVDAIGNHGEFGELVYDGNNVEDDANVEGAPDGVGALVGDNQTPMDYRGYILVQNVYDWDGIDVVTTEWGAGPIELLVSRGEHFISGGTFDGYSLVVQAGGFDLTDLYVVTPWGGDYTASDYLPGTWDGEDFWQDYGLMRLEAYHEGPEQFLEMSFRWNGDDMDVHANPVGVMVSYTEGSWNTNVAPELVALPDQSPTIVYPELGESGVDVSPTIAWNLWDTAGSHSGVVAAVSDMTTWALEEDPEQLEWLAPDTTSWTPADPLDVDGEYVAQVAFTNYDWQEEGSVEVGVFAEVFCATPFYTGAAAEQASIAGTVYDYDTGEPLAGVYVNVYQSGDPTYGGWNAWDYVDSVYTDDFGHYEFSGLVDRTYRVHVYSGQSISETVYFQQDVFNVEVSGGQASTPADLHLHHAGSIVGYVYDSDENPIEGIEVAVEAAYIDDIEYHEWNSDQTDASGRYEIFLPLTDLDIYPVKIGWASDYYGNAYSMQIAPGFYAAEYVGASGPDFYLEDGGWIEGYAETSTGLAVAYRDIMEPWTYVDNGMFEDPNAYTDSEGYFHIPVPADVEIVFSTSGWSWEDFQAGGDYFAWGERWIGPYSVSAGQTLNIGTFVVPQGRQRFRNCDGPPLATRWPAWPWARLARTLQAGRYMLTKRRRPTPTRTGTTVLRGFRQANSSSPPGSRDTLTTGAALTSIWRRGRAPHMTSL